MEDKSKAMAGKKEIFEQFVANRHQSLIDTVLNKPYIPKAEVKKSLEQICSNITASIREMGSEDIKNNTAVISGKGDNNRALQLVSSPLGEDKTDQKLSLSLTFISDDINESASTDLFFELAKQLSFSIEKIYLISRVKKPIWLPENISYTKIGLGGDIISAIPISDLVISNNYMLLESIKIANEVPLIYFACEDIYLDTGVDLKEKIILAASLKCADAAICFNSRIYKKLVREYGLSVVLMKVGIDGDIFSPPADLPAYLEQRKNHSEMKDQETDPQSNAIPGEEDNFWHLQRNSLYRNNGLFGKNRFDYSYHFMMREEKQDSETGEEDTDACASAETAEDEAFLQLADVGEDLPNVKENYSHTILFVIDEPSDLYGLDILIKVAEGLNNQNPDVKVIAASRQPIAGFPSNTEVRIIRDTHDLAGIYRIVDMYVAAEKSSNFAQHALEAMSSGVPVISSDHYGIIDFARHGDNAMLAPVADAKSTLDIIQRLLHEEELQERLKSGGLETARLYGWPLVAQAYISLFSAVADLYLQAKQISVLSDTKAPAYNDEALPAMRSGKKNNKLDSEVKSMPNGRYGIFLSSQSPEVSLNLEDLEFSSATVADSLVDCLESMDFEKLAIPVSRDVTNRIKRVTWEVIATRKAPAADDGKSIRYVYLPASSKPIRFLKGANPALADFSNGNYGEALKILTDSVKTGNTNSRAAVSRWVILALLGLDRKEDALRLALAWRDSFVLHPDFYLLAYHAAKGANMFADYEDTREKIEILGAGENYSEWFESPLELLEEDVLLS